MFQEGFNAGSRARMKLNRGQPYRGIWEFVANGDGPFHKLAGSRRRVEKKVRKLTNSCAGANIKDAFDCTLLYRGKVQSTYASCHNIVEKK